MKQVLIRIMAVTSILGGVGIRGQETESTSRFSNPLGGSWGETSNWEGGEHPGFHHDSVLIFAPIGLNQDVETTLDAHRTAARLVFGNGDGDIVWNIRPGAPADSSLTLEHFDQNIGPEINVTAGHVRLYAPLTATANQGFSKRGPGGLELSHAGNQLEGEVSIFGGTLTLHHGSDTCNFIVKPSENYAGQTRVDLRIKGDAVFDLASQITLANYATGTVANARARLISESGNNALENPLLIDSGSHQELVAEAGQLHLNGGISIGGEPSSLIMLRGREGEGFVRSSIQLGEACILVKTDDGVWEISATGNTWSNTWGNTNVSRGTLRMGADHVLPSSTSLRIGSDASDQDAVLDLNGFDQEVAELTAQLGGGGRKAITSQTPAVLTIANETDTEYAGELSGPISIRKRGAATLILSGPADITGEISIESGTLAASRELIESVSLLRISSDGRLQLTDSEPVRTARVNYNAEFLPNGVYTSSNARFIEGPGSLDIYDSPQSNRRLFWRPTSHPDHEGDTSYTSKRWASSPQQIRWSSSATSFTATSWDNALHADFTADFTGDHTAVRLVDTIKVSHLVLNSTAVGPQLNEFPKMNYDFFEGVLDFGDSTGFIELNSPDSRGAGFEVPFRGSGGLSIRAQDDASLHVQTSPTGVIYLFESAEDLTGGFFIEHGFVALPDEAAVGNNRIHMRGDSGLMAPVDDYSNGHIDSREGVNMILPNDIELSGDAHSFYVPSDRTLTLRGKIEGANGLIKAGEGTLVLDNTESQFLGATKVLSGEVRLATAALDSASELYLNGGSIRLDPSVIQVVSRLTLNGQLIREGEFDSSHHSGLISGEGYLVVDPTLNYTPFESWITSAGHGIEWIGSRPMESADGSGVPNLSQFALGGDAANPSDNGFYKAHFTNIPHGDEAVMSLTIAVRKGALFSGRPSPGASVDGITYTIRGSHDLRSWDVPVDEIVGPPAEDNPPPGGYEFRSFRLLSPPDEHSVGFFSIEVTDGGNVTRTVPSVDVGLLPNWILPGGARAFVIGGTGGVMAVPPLPEMTNRQKGFSGMWRDMLSMDVYGLSTDGAARMQVDVIDATTGLLLASTLAEVSGMAPQPPTGPENGDPVHAKSRVWVDIPSSELSQLESKEYLLRLRLDRDAEVIVGAPRLARYHQTAGSGLEAPLPYNSLGPDKLGAGLLGFEGLLEHQIHGTSVTSVRSGGPADQAGMRQGDVILAVNDVPLPLNDVSPGWNWFHNSHESVIGRAGEESLAASKPVTLDVMREGSLMRLELTLPLRPVFTTLNPENDPAAAAMVEDMITWLVDNQRENGSWKNHFVHTTFAALALLATGEESHHPRVRRAVDWMLARYPSTDKYPGLGFWDSSYVVTLYSEWYLVSEDERVLQHMRDVQDWVIAGSHESRWGFPGLGHGPNGLPYGNAGLVSAGCHFLIFEGIAMRFGMDPKIWDLLKPYMEASWADPNKGGQGSMGYNPSLTGGRQRWFSTGSFAMAAHLHGKRPDMRDEMIRFMRFEYYPWFRNSHAYGEPGGAWGLLGLNLVDPHAFAEVMQKYAWSFSLAWEPGHGLHYTTPHNMHPSMAGPDLLNAAYALVLQAPKRSLVITGRDP